MHGDGACAVVQGLTVLGEQHGQPTSLRPAQDASRDKLQYTLHGTDAAGRLRGYVPAVSVGTPQQLGQPRPGLGHLWAGGILSHTAELMLRRAGTPAACRGSPSSPLLGSVLPLLPSDMQAMTHRVVMKLSLSTGAMHGSQHAVLFAGTSEEALKWRYLRVRAKAR
jgi:hypothetical protein